MIDRVRIRRTVSPWSAMARLMRSQRSNMNTPDFAALDLAICRARVGLSLRHTPAAMDCLEGHTSPSFALFLFAVIAAGCWSDPRATILVAATSVTMYLVAIAFGPREVTNLHVMRAAYFAVAGYLSSLVGNGPSRASPAPPGDGRVLDHRVDRL